MASPWAAACLAMKCPLLQRKEGVNAGAQTAVSGTTRGRKHEVRGGSQSERDGDGFSSVDGARGSVGRDACPIVRPLTGLQFHSLLSVTWSFRLLKSFSSCSLLFDHFG